MPALGPDPRLHFAVITVIICEVEVGYLDTFSTPMDVSVFVSFFAVYF